MAEETQDLAETTSPAATGADTAPESSDVQSEGALNPTATDTTDTTPETTEAAPQADAANENPVAEAPAETASSETAPAESAPAEAAPARSSSSQPELNDVLSSHGEDNGPRKDVENGRAYEIIYIARIGDESVNEATVTRVRELIDGKDGAVDNVRSTEARRLAYEIAGQSDGIYYIVNARFAADHMSEIDRFFKLEESVIRHMILRED